MPSQGSTLGRAFCGASVTDWKAKSRKSAAASSASAIRPRGLPGRSPALHFDDGWLKPQRVHVGKHVDTAITGFGRHPGGLANAFQQERHEFFELVAGQFGHQPLDDTVAGVRLGLLRCGNGGRVVVGDFVQGFGQRR